jgi:predicted DNA-binding transcriptional regulator AlpA
MDDIDYEKLADSIARKLRLLPPPDKIIWTGKQAAEYLGMSAHNFVNRVSKSVNFPLAIKLPTDTGSRCQSRWYAQEIQEWVKKQKRAA